MGLKCKGTRIDQNPGADINTVQRFVGKAREGKNPRQQEDVGKRRRRFLPRFLPWCETSSTAGRVASLVLPWHRSSSHRPLHKRRQGGKKVGRFS